MAEFTPITTQEAFDAALAERLAPYADYGAVKARGAALEKQLAAAQKAAQETEKKYAGYEEKLAALESAVRTHEAQALRQKVAYETGIPFELAGHIHGETEEDIRKDAALLARYTVSSKWTPPLADAPDGGLAPNDAALQALTQSLLE